MMSKNKKACYSLANTYTTFALIANKVSIDFSKHYTTDFKPDRYH